MPAHAGQQGPLSEDFCLGGICVSPQRQPSCSAQSAASSSSESPHRLVIVWREALAGHAQFTGVVFPNHLARPVGCDRHSFFLADGDLATTGMFTSVQLAWVKSENSWNDRPEMRPTAR